MPKLRLPPLPPAEKWKNYFPRALLPLPLDPFAPVDFPNRILPTNREHTDEFVRALKLKENDIVLEQWGGPGQLTRSLVNGGNKVDEGPIAQAWKEHGPVVTKPSQGYKAAYDQVVRKRKSWSFPEWLDELPDGNPEASKASKGKKSKSTTSKAEPSATEAEKSASESETSTLESETSTLESNQMAESSTTSKQLPRPRLVVATESSPELLVRGLGLEPDNVEERIETLDRYGVPGGRTGYRFPDEVPKSKGLSQEERDAVLQQLDNMAQRRQTSDPAKVFPSLYEPNLLLNPSSPHVTALQRHLLANPLISQHIEKFDPNSDSPDNRPWNAPPPNIVFVATIPDGSRGETMLHRWIHSPIGAAQGTPSWFWTYGRIRIAFLLGRRFYDRLTSGPGEACHSKITIVTKALFDLTPLPPYHHVFNNDKQSRGTEPRPPGFMTTVQGQQAKLDEFRATYDKGPRTIMYPNDIYPRPVLQAGETESRPFPRPPLLGLLLEPKVNCVITMEQRQVWDFVLRRLFVRQSHSLRDSLPSLAFGANLLVNKIEGKQDPGSYSGIDTDTDKIIKDLTVEEWFRIVDVVDKWPFKPSSMLLADYAAGQES
ncbi:hypothetical protein BCR39DRAFT_519166 [Naematelia encephala]|uniref:Mitochondrial transcription factor 1 n=1 Tax=Naematelia encephala TaxID=71784 RepID=A0A1Y2BG21_9TREE|nr:hypothetical protein BCR39DRAFT_519166 [Naematelia encephala]